MDWRDVPTFYQARSKTIIITQIALHLLLLTRVRSTPLPHIRENQIDEDIWKILGAKI